MSAAEQGCWIVPTGVRAVEEHISDAVIPDAALDDSSLSLIAKGIYALVLSRQGEPVNPCDDAIEDLADIRSGIDELLEAGLVTTALPRPA